MILGQRIKKLREFKNLTQEYISSELGITQSSYSKIESGETDIPFSRLEQISKILGLNPEDIISFNETIVFNLINNKTANGLVINNQTSQIEKNLYEQYIETLKSEISHLKSVIDKLLRNKRTNSKNNPQIKRT